MSEFTLIAGLGNPGPRYINNRHNIGFQTVDNIAESYRVSFSRSEHRAQTAHGFFDDRRIILAKPQTWMNESGKSLAPLVNFYKIPPERMLIIYDDLDIPLGTVRYRQDGSSGGHRGVQSIIQHLGTQAFPRLRLGIGRPPGRMDAAAYVLQNFSEEEMTVVWEVIRLVRTLIQDWVTTAPNFTRPAITWRVENENTT